MFTGTLFRKSLFAMCTLLCTVSSLHGNESAFAPTIPVLDMQEYYNPETRENFYKALTTALHEVGFFAVVNPGLDVESLEKGYEAAKFFFNAPLEQKLEIHKPELSGQRGYVLGETAAGAMKKDFKEHLHIGRAGNLWPIWMDLQGPMENLMGVLDVFGEYIQKGLAYAVNKPENFFTDMTKNGECLLRPIHYMANPEPGQFWAGEHTDIDLFTILPMATEAGLQLFHNGEWIDVRVPANAFIVNAGDMLMNMSNGYFRSGKHRVVSKKDCERFSIVYFVHPRDEDDMSPLQSCIELTEGYAQFPQCNRLEMLAVRLREIKVASPALISFIDACGINERIRDLALSGHAHASVVETYNLWLEWMATQAK